MAIQRITRTIVATASGAATQSYNTSYIGNGGQLLAVAYTRGTASAPSTAAGITITGQQSGIVLLDVSATGTSGVKTWFFPTANAQSTSGELKSAATGAGAVLGSPLYLPVAQEAINIDIASATAGGTPGAGSGGLNISFDFYLLGL